MEGLTAHASPIQTLALVAAYAATVVWERRRARLAYGRDDRRRLTGNLGLLAVNQVLPFLLLPMTAAFSAWIAAVLGLGLLDGAGLPFLPVLLVAIVALDLAGWIVHWAMHRLAPLWRIHRVHHSDLRFDSSLGFRFHPGEVALVALANTAVIVVVGLPLEAVLLSGVIATLHNFFGHANAGLGPVAERRARRVIITPDLHRVHHSADAGDAMHNFGIVLSCWDRLAGTYRAPVGAGPTDFGLDTERDPQRLSLWRLLAMPFLRAPSSAEAPLQDPSAAIRPRR
jgi:sterol desaturase/sphingolipid hydroxylase (fatty acid hydroxylase superfamily)